MVKRPDGNPAGNPVRNPTGYSNESHGDADIALTLGDLGAGLLDAGYAVTDVQQALCAVGQVNGRPDLTIGVLPSAILVDDPRSGRTRLVNSNGAPLTFAQVADVAELARNAELGLVDLGAIRGGVRNARNRGPKFPRPVAVLGSGLQSAGIAVVFRTTWWGVALDFVLALLVGAVIIYGGRIAGLITVLPIVAAFLVSAVVYGLAADLQLGAVTLFVVCAPLVILIPGATITTGVVELAAGDVVSGGGRFVSGLIMWATLAVGIAAGAGLVGVPASTYEPPGSNIAGWVIWPAVIVLAIGVGLFFDAPWSLTGVLIGVLLATYAVVAVAQLVTAGPVASGIAAAVMLPVLRLLEVFQPRWPAAVTFRPAFWLLVPGSLGLVAITSLAAGDSSSESDALLAGVVATVVAIAVGVQIGAVISALVRGRPAQQQEPE